jgi:hypothetical protein
MNRPLVVAACLLAAETTSLADSGQALSAEELAAPQPEAYPTAYIERPLTLPAMMAEASATAAHWWIDDEEDESTGRALASVGLTDWWQVSTRTRFFLSPERAWSETVGVASRLLVVDTARFDFAPGLDATLLFDGDRDTPGVRAVAIDSLARFRIWRRAALYLGDDLARFGFGDGRSISVDLRAAYVTQLGDHVALRVSALLVHLRAFGDGPVSGGPSVPAMSTIVTPASWIDLWVGFQPASDSEGLFGGLSCRL